jgi:hypothetical protein
MNYIKLDPTRHPIAINLSAADIQDIYPNAYEISADQYRQEIFGTPSQPETSFHQSNKEGGNH